MKKLIIAEKPSVALDYKKALLEEDSFKEHTGYVEGEKYIISHTVGHLLTIAEPSDISPAYKGWKLSVLPILPPKYPIVPIKGTEKQLNVLLKLVGRADVSTIINGCDAGREGELIFRYVLEYAGSKCKNKTIQRLWLQSMTQESIRSAFKNLRTDKEMQNLYDAAKSRAEADWVVGINASRAFTAYQSLGGGFVLTPCGRVQTPTLMMMVNREQERLDFVPQPYYQIYATIQGKKSQFIAQWFDKSKLKSKEEKSNRIWDEKQAQDIVKKIMNQTATVTETQKQSTQSPPLLYDLTTLQREANSRFGFSAKTTLGIVQSLYETHKLVTYPRTSSKHLPEDYKGTVKATFESLKEYPLLGKFAKQALSEKYCDKMGKKVFDNSKISDHFAIIPTVLKSPKKLVEQQQKIYLMILQRFLGVFFPPAVFLNIIREVEIKNEFFKSEGKILLEAGFKAVFFQEEEKNMIPKLETTPYICSDVELKNLETQPPSRFSESTLLSAMEGAGKFVDDEDLRDALKDRGLGTPATRAAIIEKLVIDKYIIREQGVLIPTQKAFGLHRLIDAMKIEQLGSPELTGEWEHELSKVEQGKVKRTVFMSHICNVVKKTIDAVKQFDEMDTLKPAGFSVSGRSFNETVNKYISDDGKIEISKVIGGRFFFPQEIQTLLEHRKIGPLEGFRSRLGKPYTAMLELDEENHVKFKFDDTASTPENIRQYPVLGAYYIDQTPVYMTDTHFISESFLNGSKTGLKINRVLLGKEITPLIMEALIAGNKSPLIEGFLSSRTKRKFDAFLQLNKKGSLEFSFPEKKASKTKKATSVKTTAKKTTAVKKKTTQKPTTSKSKKTTSKKKS